MALSVPCVRVECLQRDRRRCPDAEPPTFSTLCSGRVFATRCSGAPARRAALLSVPCVRVECLQPRCTIQRGQADATFQYPVFGSSVCNWPDAWHFQAALVLSVPCVRVECLQLIFFSRQWPRFGSFSTLCSGRVFATCPRTNCPCCPIHFQYPVFGSSVCN